MLNIAFAQINPCVGNLDANAQKIIEQIRNAQKQGIELIVFPELVLVGYPPEDLLLKPHFIEKNKRYLDDVRKQCSDITALVGFADSDGENIYNACAVIQNTTITQVYHKMMLPNYGVFDEKRYFSPGKELCTVTVGSHVIGLSICEDLWIPPFLDQFQDKPVEAMVNISASPFYLGKVAVRQKVLAQAAQKLKTYVFYCNLVGSQDELVFDGTSKIFSPQGEVIACAKRFEEDFMTFSFSPQQKYKPVAIKISGVQEAYQALCLGLADYVRKNQFQKVVLGVSGGIDSAVVAAVARDALGPENVVGIIMPSPYTSKETFTDAVGLCDNLGIQHHVVKIDEIFQTYQKVLDPFFAGTKKDITEENLQARIRGNLLMAFSNKYGYLVINTGNKSEVSCGYCTLYGDMVGGFGVLKDVPKMLVYDIADYINQSQGKEIIPQTTIDRPPSAELKPDQKDSDSLPEYELLDPILKMYVEQDMSVEQMVEAGFPKDLVLKVVKLVDSNEYKRRQAPIGIKITPKAFGKDRRMPITNKYFHITV